MRRKTLVPASHEPAGFTNLVSTSGQPPCCGLGDVGSPYSSKEPPESRSARVLSASTALSPHTYALRRRIERSLNLLKQNNITVAMAFQHSGFDTEAQFVQAFSEMIGVTPLIYRENVLNAKRVASGRSGQR
jgi:hypothetical protein